MTSRTSSAAALRRRELVPAVDHLRLRLLTELLGLAGGLEAGREHPRQRPRAGHAVDLQLGVLGALGLLERRDRLDRRLVGHPGLIHAHAGLDLPHDLGRVPLGLAGVEADRRGDLRGVERAGRLVGHLALHQRGLHRAIAGAPLQRQHPLDHGVTRRPP